MARLAALLVVIAAPVLASDWQTLTGPEIEATLNGAKLEYSDGSRQDFYASGKTLYNAGRDSWGYWRVQGDEYCSQWPPNAGWSCYGVDVRITQIRFVDPAGNQTVGTAR